jgi:hypothetical protein
MGMPACSMQGECDSERLVHVFLSAGPGLAVVMLGTQHSRPLVLHLQPFQTVTSTAFRQLPAFNSRLQNRQDCPLST